MGHRRITVDKALLHSTVSKKSPQVFFFNKHSYYDIIDVGKLTSAEARRQAALRQMGKWRGGDGHKKISTTSATNRTTHVSSAATATASPVLEKPVLSRSFCSRLVAAANAWNFPLLVAVPLLLSADGGGGAATVPLFFSVWSEGAFFRHGSRSSSAGDRQPPSGLSCISTLFLRSWAIFVIVTLQRCTSDGWPKAAGWQASAPLANSAV